MINLPLDTPSGTAKQDETISRAVLMWKSFDIPHKCFKTLTGEIEYFFEFFHGRFNAPISVDLHSLDRHNPLNWPLEFFRFRGQLASHRRAKHPM